MALNTMKTLALAGIVSLASAQSSTSTLASSVRATPIGSVSRSAVQSPTSTYSESDVPTGTPLPGNYDGDYRPQVHFSPPQGFMNDPNGMFVDENGTYHLYYQCEF
jgi:beta-fructofuranosidase